MYDVLSVVRGWGHPLDSWPGCLPGDCQYVLSRSSVRSSSYSCSKVSPKRSTPLQIHVSHFLIKHGSMRLEVTQRGNRCRERHVVIAAMYEQRPTAAATLDHAPGCLTGIVSNVSALEARTTRERRHDVAFFRLFCKECEHAVAGRRVAKRGVASDGGVLFEGCDRQRCFAPSHGGVYRTVLPTRGVGRTCFYSFFDSFTCASLSVEVFFSRHHRGAHTAARESTRRVEPPVSRSQRWVGKTRRDEGGATYSQTSNPSLSNSTSTTSEDKWKCVVRVWGRGEGEGRGPAGQATFAAFVRRHPRRPCATQGFPRRKPQMHATTGNRAQKWVFRLSASSLEASCLPSHCMTAELATPSSRPLYGCSASFRPRGKFANLRTPAAPQRASFSV
jgi:hypothetical protein